MDDAQDIQPDTKDWTWVLERPCEQCGYDGSQVRGPDLAALVRRDAEAWSGVLDAPGAGTRPAPGVWSPLEYACHVRDVHEVFRGRVSSMLERDDPLFDNWDQDATALEGRYDQQDPAAVAVELVQRAEEVAAVYARVRDDQWQRRGRRSNGSVFTVESLGRYHLHDDVHHLWDVGVTGHLPS